MLEEAAPVKTAGLLLVAEAAVPVLEAEAPPAGMEPAGMEPAGMEAGGIPPAGMEAGGIPPAGMDAAGMEPTGFYRRCQRLYLSNKEIRRKVETYADSARAVGNGDGGGRLDGVDVVGNGGGVGTGGRGRADSGQAVEESMVRNRGLVKDVLDQTYAVTTSVV
jgi:hypothetical protein